MANQHVNKVVYAGRELINLMNDTVTTNTLLYGFTAHDKTGATIEGGCLFDSNTTDANAARAEILYGKTAYVNKVKVTGSMPNVGKATGTISTVDGEYGIAQGYHDGSGKVTIDATEQAKLVATNIRQGVTVLGVTGTMSGEEGVKAQSKEVTPTKDGFTVTPDTSSDYNYLSQVKVKAVPYSETDNPAGGITVTIL